MSNLNVYSGDKIYIKYSTNYLYYAPDGLTGKVFYFSQTKRSEFTIIKVIWDRPSGYNDDDDNCDDDSCYTIRKADAGSPIFYGDMIWFYIDYDENLGYIQSPQSSGFQVSAYIAGNPKILLPMNNCNYITPSDASSEFVLCEDEERSKGLWIPVSTSGTGYLPDNSGLNVSYLNLTYGKLFIQNVSAQVCEFNSRNQYLCAGEYDLDSDYPYILSVDTISNNFPDKGDHPGFDLTIEKMCDATSSCLGLCNYKPTNPSAIISGSYVCFYSTNTNLPVDIESSDQLGFNDTNIFNPGDTKVTFLIKKIDTVNNKFYKSDDENSTICSGELFVLMAKKYDNSNMGFIYTAKASSGALNNIYVYDSNQIYNDDNGCGNDGNYFASWIFVETEQSGILGAGSINTDRSLSPTTRPVYFGKSYMIQNYGQAKCTSVNTRTGISDTVFWKQDGDIFDFNTPNLNASSIYAQFPTTSDFYFYMLNINGTTTCKDTTECPVNDCSNCPDECDTEAGCCGCNVGWSFGMWVGKFFELLGTILGWVIIIIVILIIFFIIFLLIKVISSASRSNKKADKEERDEYKDEDEEDEDEDENKDDD